MLVSYQPLLFVRTFRPPKRRGKAFAEVCEATRGMDEPAFYAQARKPPAFLRSAKLKPYTVPGNCPQEPVYGCFELLRMIAPLTKADGVTQ